MRAATTILSICLVHLVGAQSIVSFNDSWKFSKGPDTLNQSWTEVQVPHTWNAKDPFDKEPGLQVDFKKIEGEPMISAIQIRKLN